jgi:acyl transferase domain-containing protein/acyl carrier protein
VQKIDNLDNKIAITGIALRFPDADDHRQLWQNLKTGRESIHRFSEEELLHSGLSKEVIDDPKYVPAGAIVRGIDYFDYPFFDMTRIEAETTDIQSRIFLQCAWHALEDACIHPEKDNGHVGVFAGAGFNMYLYRNLRSHYSDRSAAELFQILFTNEKEFMVTNTAYRLNLKGPAVNIQTACSTSLVAVHYACQSLLNGECDIALAGGSSFYIPAKAGYLAHEGMIFSPDGRCRPFDADANGTVPGNGCGIVVLKRLKEAMHDQNHIYAIIRGSATGNDGSGKVGFTAPGIDGQIRVIDEALMVSETHPDQVRYIETHGTGTHLGDPIEFSALQQTYQTALSKGNEIILGSIKSNMGHLNTAAGVAGLIKAALVLYHKEIPPTLHFNKPNPEIGMESTPFSVNTTPSVLINHDTATCTAVSSFGIGGTNAHMILEEPPNRQNAGDELKRRFYLIPFTAKSEKSLQNQMEKHSRFAEAGPDSIDDYAQTMGEFRCQFDKRSFIVTDSMSNAAQALSTKQKIIEASNNYKIVFIFPGQGSQYAGMCKELYGQFSAFKNEVDRCLYILQDQHNLDVRDFLLNQDFDLSRNAATVQILLFITQQAIARLLLDLGISPDVVCGHSIGEYAAASIADVFSCEQALAMLMQRGRLLENLPESRLHLVMESEQRVRNLLSEYAKGEHSIQIATINSPQATVVGGQSGEIRAFARWLKANKTASISIHTDKAFHTSHIAEIESDYKSFLSQIAFQVPVIPFASGVVKGIADAEHISNAGYWTSQTIKFVNFQKTIESVRTHLANEHLLFVECGPGSSLSSFIQNTLGPSDAYTTLQCLPAKFNSGDPTFHNTIGQLWQRGVEIEWSRINGSRGLSISAPGYAFEEHRCWKEPVKQQATKTPVENRVRLYTPVWRECLMQDRFVQPSLVLIFDLPGAPLSKGCRENGYEPVTVLQGAWSRHEETFHIDPEQEKDFAELFTALSPRLSNSVTVVYGWSAGNKKNDNYMIYAIRLLRNLCKHEHRQGRMIAVCRLCFNVMGNEKINADASMLTGVLMAMPYEYPELAFTFVDLPDSFALHDPALSKIFQHADRNTILALRGKKIWSREIAPLVFGKQAASPLFRQESTILITGGLGKLGLFLAEYLARTYKANLILTRSEPFPKREEWRHWVLENPDSPTTKIIKKLEMLEQQYGSTILTFQAFVEDETEMNKVVRESSSGLGHIHGVIHAAGLTDMTTMKAIEHVDRRNIQQHQTPKLEGAKGLAALDYGRKPEFMIFISSLSVFLGGFGMAAYIAANAAMDAVADQLAARGTKVFCIHFPGLDLSEKSHVDAWPGNRKSIMRENELTTLLPRLFSARLPYQVIVSHRHPDLNTILADMASRRKDQESSTRQAQPDLVPPQTDLERDIVQLFKELLGVEPVGMTDNFFELGGNSLAAAQLNARISSLYDIDLPVDRVLANPTPAELCDAVLTIKLNAKELPETILDTLENLSEEEAKIFLENLDDRSLE